ncbi:hypothetical protein [Streptomyces sp. e14]|uniref:hypothetical protein n=1 Tax=Streptomyces sp. e14 TaxID=645465 RepID=UPI0002E6699D|nr:hypothetical protein [Streptomyces sp. e14]
MRRTTLTTRTLHRGTLAATTAAAAAAALLLAGCGTQDDDGKGGSTGAGSGGATASASASASASPSGSASVPGSPSGPGSASAPPSATGSAPASPSGCVRHVELTAADTGRTVCLTVGGSVRMNLDGTKERPWSPVKAEGGILKGANAGIVILPGDALAAFTASAPGTARLSASRPLCATGPGKISCLGIQEWTVTVKVTRP